MISYEIKRRQLQEQPPPAPAAPTQSNPTLFQRIANRQVLQQNPQLSRPVNLHGTPIIDEEKISEKTGLHPIGMGKIEYARWLGVHVYPRFPKGTQVTLASLPFVPGNAPPVWFKVSDHQELHYCAHYDKETRQPKCVAIQNPAFGSSFPVYYPPAALRVLQPEEIQAIDRLRNQASDGRDEPITRLDGTEESVDRSTGETS